MVGLKKLVPSTSHNSPGVDDLAADHLGDGGGRHLLEGLGLWGVEKRGERFSRRGIRCRPPLALSRLVALGLALAAWRPRLRASHPPIWIDWTAPCLAAQGLGTDSRDHATTGGAKGAALVRARPPPNSYQERQRLVRPGAHRFVDGGLDLLEGSVWRGGGRGVSRGGQKRKKRQKRTSAPHRKQPRRRPPPRSRATPPPFPPPLCRIEARASEGRGAGRREAGEKGGRRCRGQPRRGAALRHQRKRAPLSLFHSRTLEARSFSSM